MLQMKSIILTILVLIISLFTQQTAASAPTAKTLEVKAINPKMPATLASGEKITVTILYSNPSQNAVRITPAPYKGGQMVPQHSVTGSTRDPGDGETELQLSFKGAATVDELRIEMYDSKTDKLLGTTKVPAKLTWTGAPPAPGSPTAIAAAAETKAAQAEAIRRYPDIAKPDSAANKAFLKTVEEAKKSKDPNLDRPTWPLIMAIRSQ